MSPTPKPPVPLYYWPLWMGILALALVVFYGILTPVWMAIRAVAWLSERPPFRTLTPLTGAHPEGRRPAAPTESFSRPEVRESAGPMAGTGDE